MFLKIIFKKYVLAAFTCFYMVILKNYYINIKSNLKIKYYI